MTSKDRSIPGDVDLPRLIKALNALSTSFVEGRQGSYGMRIPAEPYRDGDLVCSQAARMVNLFSSEWANRCKEIERLHALLTNCVQQSPDHMEHTGKCGCAFCEAAEYLSGETGAK
jgi:hypothetical protein